jgi:hypothetical protein
VRIRVYAHIRTIIVLIGDKLIGFYFPQLLYTIYYSVMTHLRIGKKVSYATDCGETSKAHPVRGRGLECHVQWSVREVNMFPQEHMKTSHRMMWIPDAWGQSLSWDMNCIVYHATGHDHTPRVWGFRNVLWPPSTRSEYVLVTYATLSVHCWTYGRHLGDKWRCMIVYLSFSVGMLTTIV